MAGKRTPTYTIEFSLHIPLWQQHRLEKRFKVARMVYNSCLGEALKRHKAVRNDKQYRTLLHESKSKERNNTLEEIRLSYGFSEFGIHHFVKEVQHKFKEHIGSFEAKNWQPELFKP